MLLCCITLSSSRENQRTAQEVARVTYERNHKAQSGKVCFRHSCWKAAGRHLSNRGIEANPAKIRALSQLATPTALKQVQKLIGCMLPLEHCVGFPLKRKG